MNNLNNDDGSAEGDSLIEHYLTEIRKRVPVVDRTLALYGDMPLSEYLDVVTETASERYQSHEDLGDAVYEYALPLLGEEAAAIAREELKQSPVVLTANHHGVDYFAQSVQGTLLFSQRKLPNGQKAKTVPVFACGSIPLDNLTYPRGALLYATEGSKLPLRLPLFPDRMKRKMVSEVASVDEGMIVRAQKVLGKRVAECSIPQRVSSTLSSVLNKYCVNERSPTVAGYSEQSMFVNQHIWEKILGNVTTKPVLIYMELEKIVSILLRKDLQNSDSLAYQLLFCTTLRENFLVGLDGIKGCWTACELTRRLTEKEDLRHQSSKASGTFMFWGVGDDGQKIPLLPIQEGNEFKLVGVDDSGEFWQIELTPSNLYEALDQGRLLPSVMACFIALTFARGVTCAGGYYQGDYLTEMRDQLGLVIRQSKLSSRVISSIENAPVDSYLSGMQAVMYRSRNGGLMPAGPIEIIASGGLENDEIDRINSMTVAEAHAASLYETVNDVAVELAHNEDFRSSFSSGIENSMPNKLIIKTIY
ncbi:MAG: hypothetical protein ACJAZP_002335 [Psychromonas sp.]|jgi:hypothetical protein|uniref:hypothetical protein n=1 Tax=Psychromonas sp. TaxID=1884585 RepID=UPI0039E6A8FD